MGTKTINFGIQKKPFKIRLTMKFGILKYSNHSKYSEPCTTNFFYNYGDVDAIQLGFLLLGNRSTSVAVSFIVRTFVFAVCDDPLSEILSTIVNDQLLVYPF